MYCFMVDLWNVNNENSGLFCLKWVSPTLKRLSIPSSGACSGAPWHSGQRIVMLAHWLSAQEARGSNLGEGEDFI